ncbi:phosphoribosyl-AMP cyclohydrolase [Granulosicoccus sp. 3-233]|uniref:phosphoribosyl-AMP cyclohydrolase n=1 Tax=Granulosicoccus sp. 3-233 TaxID=3417969 RepID=UPI003D34C3F6
MIEAISFNDAGLIPAIAQDASTGQVLMVAWMNEEALLETISSKKAVYFSRSRQRLWRKGEESGHVQQVEDIHLDCDGDVILLKVVQIGGIACHTGREHCFFRRLDDEGEWQDCEPVLKSPEDIYQLSDD